MPITAIERRRRNRTGRRCSSHNDHLPSCGRAEGLTPHRGASGAGVRETTRERVHGSASEGKQDDELNHDRLQSPPVGLHRCGLRGTARLEGPKVLRLSDG
jgi:hypothetical protein